MPSGLNSTGELLQLFRRGAVATRSELQQATGLARSTITHKVDALLAAQYLVEDGSIVDGRGRPATRSSRSSVVHTSKLLSSSPPAGVSP